MCVLFLSCASLVITPLPFPSRSGAGAKPHFLGLVFENYLYVVLSSRSPYFPCIVFCSQTDLFHSVCHPQVLSGCLRLYFVPMLPSCFHPHPFPSFLLAASVPLNCRFHCLEHSVPPPQVDRSFPSFTVWFKHHLHRKAFHNSSC